jgi:tRNA(fMet)-specific endonuclease VapC
MRYLLDTSAYIDLHRKPAADNPLDRASVVLISVITLGELYSGFKRGGLARQEKELRRFLQHPKVAVVDVSADTAEFYAEVFEHLRRAGSPVPTNDLWIAATAMQCGARILTSDRHFLRLPQVLVELVGTVT